MSLRVGYFCLALVEQLGDVDRWYVQLAAIWHWHLYNILNFILYLSIPFLFSFFVNLVLIN